MNPDAFGNWNQRMRPHPEPYGELGGKEYDEAKYIQEGVRADLCGIASQISLEHGPRIIDAILKRYTIKRKMRG
jgi:hypothetical protein